MIISLLMSDLPAGTINKDGKYLINTARPFDPREQMAHIHLEDGAFTPFWLIVWNLIAVTLIGIALLALKRQETSPRKLAIAGMCAAVGFAVFQVEVPTPLGPAHMNFTPLIGILVGPGLGSVVVLVVNVFSAAIGHGGWGMIGPNSIINIAEVVLGYYGFRLFRNGMKRSYYWSGLSSTIVALTVSSLLVVLVVGMSEIQGSSLSREQTINNMLVLAMLNVATGIIEGVVTGYVIAFLGRVRPDLLALHTTGIPPYTIDVSSVGAS